MDNKIIVILGQTASGKTDLSIKLAKKFRGEIVSADSRQVYRGLNIGAGKVTKSEMKGVKHHLLDVTEPKHRFTVAQYQKLATKAIQGIQKRGRLPFLVGGTGFYIQSIVDGIVMPEVKPNLKLRKELENKTTEELFAILAKLDPRRAQSIDLKNPMRLIRAIEIIKSTRKPISPLKKAPQFNTLQIGIEKPKAELHKLIEKRLQKRMKGMIAEIKKLRRNGLSFKRMDELGLEYRFISQYVQGFIKYDDMASKLQKEIEHFAKRQMTWFKRDKRIHWIKNQKEAEGLIKNFVN
jgi:tRNA dimethylallyltransferase